VAAGTPRIHPAWWVAVAAFLTSIGAAGFRSVPGVLMHPLHMEFGWSMGVISSAVSINLVLYGLAAPFSAALMQRLGVKRVVTCALLLVALGSLLPIWMTAAWQLLLCWGVIVGAGTGAMSMSFVAVVTGRWFVARRGLVTGILTAAGATGQLIFLPILAALQEHHGWRSAALITAIACLLVVPVVVWRLHDSPAAIGTTAYGAPLGTPVTAPVSAPGNVVALAVGTLRDASRTGVFWLLAGSFAICGASTNGLVGTHFIPAAHDHGMAETAAAGLLALVGVFDVVGTIFSGWLTDRVDPRWLLGAYYLGRGASLFVLPSLFSDAVHPNMFVFILFYGLDWVATVPPTIALCRIAFGDRGPVVFGWVFASHQVGAAIAAGLAGLVRDKLGNYDLAWYVAGGLCIAASAMCLAVRQAPVRR
jgi:MFS family permease